MNPSVATEMGAPSLPLKSRLAERVREVLRAEIQHGRWQADPRRPTAGRDQAGDRPGALPSERQLAAALHVSRPTLHVALCALQNEGLVRGRRGAPWQVSQPVRLIRRRVRPRSDVMLLRFGRGKLDMLGHVFWLGLLREKLHQLGLGLSIRDPFARGVKDAANMLASFDAEHRPAFYLLASVPPTVQRWFHAQRLPALIFGTRAPGVDLPAIDIDTAVTVRHAVEHLLRRGHRRVGLLNHLPAIGGDMTACETFLRVCAEWPCGGVEPIIQSVTVRPPALEAAVRRMFARSKPPTAVITMDLETTLSVYTLLAQLGLRIPQHVSVLSCWHWPFLEFLHPLPTCYRFSWEMVAGRMARIIHNHLHLGVLSNVCARILPTLREGQSVATLFSPPSGFVLSSPRAA